MLCLPHSCKRWNTVCEKTEENLELWDIIIIYPCPKPAHSPLLGGLVLGAPQLGGTYWGQEGVQEAAGKDRACGKGSAEMQACSWEAPLHPTNLFNKVDVGRVFCKAKETNRRRQAGQLKDTASALRTEADRGVTTRSKGLRLTLGSVWNLPLLRCIFFSFQVSCSFLKDMNPSWAPSSSRGYPQTSDSASPCKCPDCPPYIIYLSNQDLLEVKGGSPRNCTETTGTHRNVCSPPL